MNRLLAVAVSGALLALACSGPRPRPESGETRERERGPDERSPTRSPTGPEIGLASFYARSLQGHRMASGARYDGRAMTCAHRTHPFGAVLRVTDVETGNSVLVKVTDRGPFTPGRVVDLSLAAAHKLQIVKRGVVRVRVERVE